MSDTRLTDSEIYRLAAEFIDAGLVTGACPAIDRVLTGCEVQFIDGKLVSRLVREPLYESNWTYRMDRLIRPMKELYYIPENPNNLWWLESLGDTPEEARQGRVLALLFMSEITREEIW